MAGHYYADLAQITLILGIIALNVNSRNFEASLFDQSRAPLAIGACFGQFLHTVGGVVSTTSRIAPRWREGAPAPTPPDIVWSHVDGQCGLGHGYIGSSET